MSRCFVGSCRALTLLALVAPSLLTLATVGCQRGQAENPREKKYGIAPLSPNMKRAGEARRDKFIQRASAGREQWKNWAYEHRDLLQKLKKKPLDDETFRAVYLSLPSSPTEAGIQKGTLSDPTRSLEDINEMGKILFTWQGPLKKRQDAEVNTFMRKEAQSHNDISLAVSMGGGGRSRITLWTSGRVTETTMVDNLPYRSGQPSLREEISEIQPPFDFLQ